MSKKTERVPSIGRLSEEMQAYVLSKLDGKTAVLAKRVCRLWRSLIYGMESCMHFWLRRCFVEIPPHALVELSRFIYLNSKRDETLEQLGIDFRSSCVGKVPWMFWREVYAEYHRCKYILDGSYKKMELHFFPLYGEVTSLHIQDNDVFSGHESGAVMRWSNIEAELNSEILYRHNRRVTAIAGLDTVSTVSDIVNDNTNFKLVSSSRDSTLIVHCVETEDSETIKHYTKTVNSVRTWGSRFVAAADKSTIQGQPIWTSPDSNDVGTEIVATLFTESVANMKAVAFWEDKVISGDEAGNLFYWTEYTHCKKTQEEMIHVTNLGSSVKTLYLLGSRVIAFTDDRKLHIGGQNIAEDHNFTSIDVYSAIQNSPECIAIRASILVIGCRGGSVFLYHLPKDCDWESLDLCHASQIIKTSVDHVNDIVIGDDGAGPVVAIATSGYCIHVVQFRQSKPTADQTEKST